MEPRQDQTTNEHAAHRAPLPGWVPRPVKRASGRTEAARTPAHVRVIGLELSDDNHALIRRRLGMKLGKFATSIERVTVLRNVIVTSSQIVSELIMTVAPPIIQRLPTLVLPATPDIAAMMVCAPRCTL